MYPTTRALLLKSVGGILGSVILWAVPAQAAYVSGTDITAQLNSDVAAGANGPGPNQAVITLPAGTFKLSSTVNLHGSILKGAGPTMTILEFTSDLGTGIIGFTGDSADTYGSFEIDDLTLEAPRPANGVPSGTCPNQMNGIHLYTGGILRRLGVNYFNSGIIVDGSKHILDEVESQENYNGLEYPVSTDGTTSGDYLRDCVLASNGLSGIIIDNTVAMCGATLLRCHTGYEPYAFSLGHASSLSGCNFVDTQFEGVGNADMADSDSTSIISGNHFAGCGWGGEYNNDIPTQPRSPVLRCGSFVSNIIKSPNAQGPTPGDMSCAVACYGNEWTTDQLTVSDIIAGNMVPITVGSPANFYGNHMRGGATEFVFGVATTALTANEPVEQDSGTGGGVVPALGVNPVYGVSIAGSVPAGQPAWIAQKGPVYLACPTNSTLTPNELIQVNSSSQGVYAATVTTGQNIGMSVGGASSGLVNAYINLPK